MATKGEPLSDLELAILRKVQHALMRSYSAEKRFIRGLTDKGLLTHNGRIFLANCAQRYRRQYALTEAEWSWVRDWMGKALASNSEPPVARTESPPKRMSSRELAELARLEEWERLYGVAKA